MNEFARREGSDSCGESGDLSKRPPFTFEQFTTELDDNDPFVLGLIGVLVKVRVSLALDSTSSILRISYTGSSSPT